MAIPDVSESSSRVFLLGPPGSFSSAAADTILPKAMRTYVHSLGQVFSHVQGEVVGIVPVRNKIIGPIAEATRALQSGAFTVLRRMKMAISFVCAAKRNISTEDVHRVYCSLISYRQCMRYLRKKFPRAIIIKNLPSTSSSYKKIVQLKGTTAVALGSENGALKYRLRIIDRDVQDEEKNWTEFALIKRRKK